MKKTSYAITSLLCIVGLSLVVRHYYYQLDRIPNESEAKAYTGSFNRANRAYFLEHQKFSTKPFPEKTEFPSESKYTYKVVVIDDPPQAITTAVPKARHLHSYTGVIFAWVDSSSNEPNISFKSVVCMSLEANQMPPELPIYPSSPDVDIDCPNGPTISASD